VSPHPGCRRLLDALGFEELPAGQGDERVYALDHHMGARVW
jgi:hypothetical protein